MIFPTGLGEFSRSPLGLNTIFEKYTMSLSSPTDSNAIDFEGADLNAGTIITEIDGVEFASSSEFGLMLFDTNNVTGDDFDLAAKDLGNVLIISEDGDFADPDSNAAGGTINVKFEDSVTVDRIGLLDIDEPGSLIIFYDENSNPIETLEIAEAGNKSFQSIELDVDRVASLDLSLAGNAALTGINYTSNANHISNEYSNIYAFGDSLTDIGNVFNATTFTQKLFALFGVDTPVLPPSPPYFEGRFSNGQIWIDNLADELDIDLTPATELSFTSPGGIPSPVTIIDGIPQISPFFDGVTGDRSVNFAYGSATTGAIGTGEFAETVPGMNRQVDFLVSDLMQSNQTADSDALYVLWGGSNDYLFTNAQVEETVGNIENQIDSLYDTGAREFLVVNVPDLALLPEANNPNLPVSPEQLSERVNAHNSLLDSTVEELETNLTGIDITILDVDSLFNDIAGNPEEFGLTNVTEPFLDPTTLAPTEGANPDEYFFFDTVHPTATVHGILSDFALETLAIEAEV